MRCSNRNCGFDRQLAGRRCHRDGEHRFVFGERLLGEERRAESSARRAATPARRRTRGGGRRRRRSRARTARRRTPASADRARGLPPPMCTTDDQSRSASGVVNAQSVKSGSGVSKPTIDSRLSLAVRTMTGSARGLIQLFTGRHPARSAGCARHARRLRRGRANETMNEQACGAARLAADDTRGRLSAGAGPAVRFFLDGGHDLLEAAHVGGGDAAGDRRSRSARWLWTRGRRRGGRRAVGVMRNVRRSSAPDLAGDETAVGEPIEDARQRRALVRQATMKVGNRRRPRGGEQREDVRLALRQAVLTQAGEIEADPMGRPMNRRHEAQRQ